MALLTLRISCHCGRNVAISEIASADYVRLAKTDRQIASADYVSLAKTDGQIASAG